MRTAAGGAGLTVLAGIMRIGLAIRNVVLRLLLLWRWRLWLLLLLLLLMMMLWLWMLKRMAVSIAVDRKLGAIGVRLRGVVVG